MPPPVGLTADQEAYVKEHDLHNVISSVLEQCLRELPSDPAAYMAQRFGHQSSTYQSRLVILENQVQDLRRVTKLQNNLLVLHEKNAKDEGRVLVPHPPTQRTTSSSSGGDHTPHAGSDIAGGVIGKPPRSPNSLSQSPGGSLNQQSNPYGPPKDPPSSSATPTVPGSSSKEDQPASSDETLVKQSWNRVKATLPLDEVGERFYKELFKQEPNLSTGLFANTDMRTQAQRLVNMLDAAVGLLDQPAALGPSLLDLGKRHHAYGVTEANFPVVASSLLAVLQDAIGLTDQLKGAWSRVYAAIQRLMVAGIEECEKNSAAEAEVRKAREAKLAEEGAKKDEKANTKAQEEQKQRGVVASVPVKPTTPLSNSGKRIARLDSSSQRAEHLVQDSWELLKSKLSLEDIGSAFYEELFTQHPDLRFSVFGSVDMKKQALKLTQSLDAAVDLLERPAELKDALTVLGSRHAHYEGVKEEHYPVVGSVLIQTLEKALAEELTPQRKKAWLSVYEVIQKVMIAGQRARQVEIENDKAKAKAEEERKIEEQKARVSKEKSQSPMELVQESWTEVKGKLSLAQIGEVFYQHLFEIDAGLKTSVFKNTDMRTQAIRLIEMIDAAVSLLGKPDELSPALFSLGERHQRYGVRSHHFSPVKEALVKTLSQGIAQISEYQLNAWSTVYQGIQQGMQEGIDTAEKNANLEAQRMAFLDEEKALPSEKVFAHVWAEVTKMASLDDIGMKIYKTILDIDPVLKTTMFSDTKFDIQARLLAATVDRAVQVLEVDPAAMKTALYDLGKGHYAYGVTPKDFDVVEKALLTVLEEVLKKSFTQTRREAARTFFGVVKREMIEGIAFAKSENEKKVKKESTGASDFVPTNPLEEAVVELAKAEHGKDDDESDDWDDEDDAGPSPHILSIVSLSWEELSTESRAKLLLDAMKETFLMEGISGEHASHMERGITASIEKFKDSEGQDTSMKRSDLLPVDLNGADEQSIRAFISSFIALVQRSQSRVGSYPAFKLAWLTFGGKLLESFLSSD